MIQDATPAKAPASDRFQISFSSDEEQHVEAPAALHGEVRREPAPQTPQAPALHGTSKNIQHAAAGEGVRLLEDFDPGYDGGHRTDHEAAARARREDDRARRVHVVVNIW